MNPSYSDGNGRESPRIDVTLIESPPWAPPAPRRQFPWLHPLLFLGTVYTTLAAGALMQNLNAYANPALLVAGIPFSFTLLAILGIHELGHYVLSRMHGVQATLPYFLPVPTFIGTFGALIKIRSPIPNRQALLDIGAAGPIAGFIVAVPAIFLGLEVSEVTSTEAIGDVLILGDSLLLWIAEHWIFGNLPDHQAISLGPVAFAGWIGLLITALNLLPIAQLDGGHIAYALLGRYHRYVAWVTLAVMVGLGIVGWPGWFVWAALATLMRLRHPPTLNDAIPLDRRRKIIAAVCLGILILCFIPVPFDWQ